MWVHGPLTQRNGDKRLNKRTYEKRNEVTNEQATAKQKKNEKYQMNEHENEWTSMHDKGTNKLIIKRTTKAPTN